MSKYIPIQECDTLVYDSGEWGIIRCDSIKEENNIRFFVIHRAQSCKDSSYNSDPPEPGYMGRINVPLGVCPKCKEKIPEELQGLWYLSAFDYIA